MKKIIRVYQDIRGKEPFTKLLFALKDLNGQKAIKRRIFQMENGHYGDVKSGGDEVSELRLMTGPGYRIYFAERGETVVILLIGGDKSTQSRDIKKAKSYWIDYKERFIDE